MKPITLITPPSGFLLDERCFPALGILRVAAVLEQAGHPVEHLDLSGVSNYQEAVLQHAAQSKSEVFGVTATTPQMPAATRIALLLRTARPTCRTIIGGPHPTLVNAACKRERRHGTENGRAARALRQLHDAFDVVVAGDGERAVFVAIREDAPALVDADDPKGPLFLTNELLNELPWPARHLIDLESYHYKVEHERAVSLIAQLGCPFSCGFCGGRQSPMLRRVRTRTTENVVAEMEYLADRYGVRGFMLYDDELNVNPRMVQLMEAIREAQDRRGEEWRLRGFVKAELFTDRQAFAMKQAGFRWLLVGFESGSPRILTNIGKRATRGDNTRCMEIARRHGLKVKALMSIGHPGESAETVADTEDWLTEQVPDDFDCTIISTYPGTAYYDEAEPLAGPCGQTVWCYTARNGDHLYAADLDYMEVQDYYKGSPGDYRAYVWTDVLTSADLVRLRDGLEARVRGRLGIPFNPSAPGVRYEATMGQLPGHILQVTGAPVCGSVSSSRH